jgi:hypothetical protein
LLTSLVCLEKKGLAQGRLSLFLLQQSFLFSPNLTPQIRGKLAQAISDEKLEHHKKSP